MSIFYKIITCFFIVLEAVVVKYLSGGSHIYIQDSLPIYVIFFFQNLISVIFVVFFLKSKIFYYFFTSNFFFNFIRVIFNVLGILFWYFSLQHLSIMSVISFSFLIPLINIFGSLFFLNEKLNIMKILMVFMAFIGFFFSMRPDYLFIGNIKFNFYFFYPFFACLFMSFSKLLVKKLMILYHSPWQLSIYYFFLSFFICFFLSLIYGFFSLSYYHWFFFFFLGLVNILINYFLAKSYVFGEIIFLLPFGLSTKLFFGSIFSYYIFGEKLDFYSFFLGIIIFLFSFLLVVYNHFSYILKK